VKRTERVWHWIVAVAFTLGGAGLSFYTAYERWWLGGDSLTFWTRLGASLALLMTAKRYVDKLEAE